MSGYVTPATSLAIDEDNGLDDALQSLVTGITGLPGDLVRPRFQPTPPVEPSAGTNWCAIGAMDETPDDSPYIGQVPTGLAAPASAIQAHLQRHLAVDVRASFYGPLSRSYAGVLRDGLAIHQNRAALEQAGMGIHDIGKIMRVPDLIGMEWRNRADMTFTIVRQLDRFYSVANLLMVSAVAVQIQSN